MYASSLCSHTLACAQVVLKPAEATPLTALALAELADRSGIPPGVLNIVVGDARAIGESPVPCAYYSPTLPGISEGIFDWSLRA